jgi:hemerythrin
MSDHAVAALRKRREEISGLTQDVSGRPGPEAYPYRVSILLSWSETFSVGHPGLDSEHRAIIDTICAVAGAKDEACRRELLNSVIGTGQAHIEHENAVLRAISRLDPATRSRCSVLVDGQLAATEHIREHEQTVVRLRSLARDADKMGSSSALYETLCHWFVGHAVKHDAQLKMLFQAITRDCPDVLWELT